MWRRTGNGQHMALNLRTNRGMAVSALAACAVIGGTSPVWATSGSPNGAKSDAQRAVAAQQRETATIAALRSEVVQLKTALLTEQAAMAREQAAVKASTDAARAAKREAAHDARAASKARAAKVRATKRAAASSVSPSSITSASTDPRVSGHRCDHSDPAGFHSHDSRGHWKH